jgi:hypothetical protein
MSLDILAFVPHHVHACLYLCGEGCVFVIVIRGHQLLYNVNLFRHIAQCELQAGCGGCKRAYDSGQVGQVSCFSSPFSNELIAS